MHAPLNLDFKNQSLLTKALTHRSYGPDHNERLEFIGDSVLNLTITAALYQQFPDEPEGVLTRFRSTLVRAETLMEIAKELQLADLLRLGAGETARDSILADTFEAIIGAVFCDSGFTAAQKFVLACYGTRLSALSTHVNLKDPKTTLQEAMQALKKPLPEYCVIDIQKDLQEHTFIVECRVEGSKPVRASGDSRRKAEQAAASLMITAILKKL